MKTLLKIIVFIFTLSTHSVKALDLLDTSNLWSVLMSDEHYFDPGLPPVGISAYLSTWYKVGTDSIQDGMYLYSLIVEGQILDTKRMVLTK